MGQNARGRVPALGPTLRAGDDLGADGIAVTWAGYQPLAEWNLSFCPACLGVTDCQPCHWLPSRQGPGSRHVADVGPEVFSPSDHESLS